MKQQICKNLREKKRNYCFHYDFLVSIISRRITTIGTHILSVKELFFAETVSQREPVLYCQELTKNSLLFLRCRVNKYNSSNGVSFTLLNIGINKDISKIR